MDKTELVYDTVIVGAGLTGLQAAISLSSNGTKVLIIDKRGFGGQAGESSLIKNLIGFRNGVSGEELIDAGIAQAREFGTEFKVPFEAQRIIAHPDGTFTIVGDNHERIRARSVLLAVGLQMKLLEAEDCSVFMHRGVSYGSPPTDPALWRGKRVGVVGGANSAAQAAWYLGNICAPCQVNMFVRASQLNAGMSEYMADYIVKSENIRVLLETEIEAVLGDEKGFCGVRVVRKPQGDWMSQELEREDIPLDHLFILIGATPYTAWLDGLVALTDRGFVLTDRDLPQGAWPRIDRQPFNYETSTPGIFAAGDVEEGSPKRASAAIGNGSSVTVSIDRYLHELRRT